MWFEALPSLRLKKGRRRCSSGGFLNIIYYSSFVENLKKIMYFFGKSFKLMVTGHLAAREFRHQDFYSLYYH